MSITNKKGQIFLMTVFVLSIAMFSSLLAISPIRNKLIQIKDMERIYQAMANAIAGIELVKTFSPLTENMPISQDYFRIVSSTDYLTTTCGGISTPDPRECHFLEISTSSNDWLQLKSKYIYFATSGDKIEKGFYEGYSNLIRRSINIDFR